jgi:folate-dependent phosphoribosylglycinamide formyltransferase PurN
VIHIRLQNFVIGSNNFMIVLVTNLSPLGIRAADALLRAQLLESIIWQKTESERCIFLRSLGWIRSWIRGRNELSIETLTKSYRIQKLKNAIPGQFVKTENINESEQVTELLRNSSATIALVIGGRILSPHTIELFHGEWLNLHGGILPRYRGLDSEYWATKECDFENIGFTLHRLTEDIDLGEILAFRKLEIDSIQVTLKKVIKENSENGLRLIQENIENFRNVPIRWNFGRVESVDLNGRYFSGAPRNVSFRVKLSEICIK